MSADTSVYICSLFCLCMCDVLDTQREIWKNMTEHDGNTPTEKEREKFREFTYCTGAEEKKSAWTLVLELVFEAKILKQVHTIMMILSISLNPFLQHTRNSFSFATLHRGLAHR